MKEASAPQRATHDDLQLRPPLNTIVINERVTVHEEPGTGWYRVLLSGLPLLQYHRDDKQTFRLVCVQLRLVGLVQQLELSAAFGHDRITQYRWERRFEKEGLSGLSQYQPEGRPVSIPESIEEAVEKAHGEGLGMRRIAERLALSINIVRGVYQRRGLQPHVVGEQQELEGLALQGDQDTDEAADEAEGVKPEAEEPSTDSIGPWDGMLRPEYASDEGVSFAGVLLALPVLVKFRVVELFREVYRSLSLIPVYGLETMVILLVCMALWRIKRAEQLKEFSPEALGKVLGLERVPEVKTVRRKLRLMTHREKARELMLKLAGIWLQQEEEVCGYLYVDGHVRVYSGKHQLAKGYSMTRHMAARATTDYWVNDRNGDPFLVVTSEINESLTQMLKPVLEEVREVVGKDRRVTLIFDRGGWSPQLFADLIGAGFDLITYRKGRSADLSEDEFEAHTSVIEGQKVKYKLHDHGLVRVGVDKPTWSDGAQRPLELRQVSKLSSTGHQTQVLTNHEDLEAVEVLWRMFARWRQENFFKYMRQEFALDCLVEYGAIGVSPELDRPNPERQALEAELEATRHKIARLQAQRCELLHEPVRNIETPPGFERYIPPLLREQTLLEQITSLKNEAQELEARRDELPERISASELERLRPESKLLADMFKTIAYRIETELLRLLAPHYCRTEREGRTLIAAAFNSSADFLVTDTELRVRIAPQSSPHRTRAINALCSSLNSEPVVVPGSNLRLILSCDEKQPVDVACSE
jgi:transposase